MRCLTQMRARLVQAFWRCRARVALLSAAVLATMAATAGLAHAQSAPIGTGLVVIDTNLADHAGKAAGTGMLLTSSGEILTNNHVIRDASSIKVVVPGTGHSYTAKVVGYDVGADVAVIQATGARNLEPIATGSSSTLKVGQPVTADGNAGGTGALAPSTGTVTALGRAITVNDDQGGSESLTGMVETNASLEPGDSGGPLLDSASKVVGMDTAAGVSSGGLKPGTSAHAYAIPINKALRIAKQVESGQASTAVHAGSTAFLGVEVSTASAASPGRTAAAGATIAQVVHGGPAAAAGLAAGDTITAIGGHTVSTPMALGKLILSEKPDAEVSVVYTDRSGASHTASVKLGRGPPQ